MGQGFGGLFDPVQCLTNRELNNLPCVNAVDFNGQRLGLQAIAVTGTAGAIVLVALHLLTRPIAVGFTVAALEVRHHPLEHARDFVDAAALVITELDLFLARTVQDQLLHIRGQRVPRRVFVELVVFGQGVDGLAEIGGFRFGPRGNGALIQRQRLVRYDQPFVKEQLHTQAIAHGARTEGRVERKQPRLDLGNGETTDRAGEILGEGGAHRLLITRDGGFQHGDAIGKVQRGAKTVSEAGLQPLLHHQPIHDHVDVVAEFLVQGGWLVQLVELTVDLNALEALLFQLGKFLAVLTLTVAHDGGQQVGTGALLHRHDAVHHFGHLLRLDRQASRGGIRNADAREQQAHVVVNFGHGADGGARVFAGGFLLDRNRRAKAADVIHIRLLHHVEELARIGAERFDIAPLPLGVDRIKGQRGFPRPRQAGNDDQLIPRQIHVDGFEVMFPRATDRNRLQLGHAHTPFMSSRFM